MKRAAVAFVIVIAFLAPLLAAASVPDPTWIAGLYDGGDGDEIVLLVWDSTPAVAAVPPALLQPFGTEPAVPTLAPHAAPVLPRAAVGRAPPLG